MKLVIGIIALLTLAACTTATPIHDQHGQPATLISCNGAMLTMESCYKKAATVCPNGYVNLGTEANNGWTASPQFAGSVAYRSLAVRCKA